MGGFNSQVQSGDYVLKYYYSNRIRIISIVILFFILISFGYQAKIQMRNKVNYEVLPPEGFMEVGGSNYVMYRVDEAYRVRNEDESWWRHGVLQPVIGTYHLQREEQIRHQLHTMYQNGQRKISIVVWISIFEPHATNKDQAIDGVFGHSIIMENGKLHNKHIENTKDLIRLISKTGYFNELNFRFAFQATAGPDTWKQWNEKQYQQNWQAIVKMRNAVEEALDGSKMKVFYDLGAELGGIENGQVPTYTQRLWKDYTQAYGKEDTYGFSVAVYPGRVGNLLKTYKTVGVFPDVYAMDVYINADKWLTAGIKELVEAGIENPQIIIQETYYNDPATLDLLQNIGKEFGIEYLYLMQWPLKRGHPVSHFSEDYAVKYDAYLMPYLKTN
jgi:hypothetical protein